MWVAVHYLTRTICKRKSWGERRALEAFLNGKVQVASTVSSGRCPHEDHDRLTDRVHRYVVHDVHSTPFVSVHRRAHINQPTTDVYQKELMVSLKKKCTIPI